METMKKQEKKRNLILYLSIALLGIGAAAYYIVSINYESSVVETNSMQINNEAPKGDLEVKVEAAMEGAKK